MLQQQKSISCDEFKIEVCDHKMIYCSRSAPDEADSCVGRPALLPSHHPSLYVISS